MKIVVLDGFAMNPGDLSWEELRKLGDLQVYDRTPREKILERMEGAQAVFTNKTPLDRATLEKAGSLRFIGVLATGYNIVDTQAARERGIAVCNVPAYSTASVVQLTFALLLEICHHVGAHSQAVYAGKWSASPDFCFWDFPLMELAGKTLGIIGCGQIGRAVAKVAKAFGMRVIGVSRRRVEDENIENVTLEELYQSADVISLHCPLTAENKGMLNQEAFAKMKKGALLINTARGALIDEEALAQALKSGQIGGAGVDVAVCEPIPADSPLLSAPHCLITPHIGWAPYEARVRLMQVTVENLRAFLAGKPQNVVNG